MIAAGPWSSSHGPTLPVRTVVPPLPMMSPHATCARASGTLTARAPRARMNVTLRMASPPESKTDVGRATLRRSGARSKWISQPVLGRERLLDGELRLVDDGERRRERRDRVGVLRRSADAVE